MEIRGLAFTIKPTHPCKDERPLLVSKFRILWVYIPVDVIEDLIQLYFDKGVDARNLLSLSGFVIAHKHLKMSSI